MLKVLMYAGYLFEVIVAVFFALFVILSLVGIVADIRQRRGKKDHNESQ